MMLRPFQAVHLFLRFLKDLVLAGLATAWLIVRGAGASQPGLVRIEVAALSPRGALLLACMLTLTPGSTVLQTDLERGQMLLHLLDTRSLEKSVCALQRRFVQPMARLFPKRTPHE